MKTNQKNTGMSKDSNNKDVHVNELFPPNTIFEKYIIYFNIGDIVYLKTDIEQRKRIVTGLTIRESLIAYGLTYGVNESWHYSFEITRDKNIVKTFS